MSMRFIFDIIVYAIVFIVWHLITPSKIERDIR